MDDEPPRVEAMRIFAERGAMIRRPIQDAAQALGRSESDLLSLILRRWEAIVYQEHSTYWNAREAGDE